MESVSSNVRKAMSHVNSGAQGLDKDAFIKHLQTKLEETLTIHYMMVDQLIYENGKGYEYYKLCEKLHFSLSRCEEDKRQLIGVVESVRDKNIDLKRQIENTEGFHKSINTREDDYEPINERIDESTSTAGPVSIVDSENGSLQPGRHSSDSEERRDSLWAYIPGVRLMENLSFINVRNLKDRFFGLRFPVLKTTKTLSDASSQTEPPSTGQTRVAFTQTVAAVHANTATQTVTLVHWTVAAQTDPVTSGTVAVQTDPTTSDTVAVQTDPTTRDTSTTAAQTDTITCDVVAVQTDVTYYRTTAVQTDARTCNAAAVQTDSTVYNVAAVQTDAVACETVAVQTNGPTTTLTYSTFSQTDRTACETVAVQTDSVSCDGGSIEMRRCTAAVLTDSASCDGGSIETRRCTVAVQTDLTIAGTNVAANQTDFCDTTNVDTTVASVKIQTDESTCVTVQTSKKNSSGDVIGELLDKFGCGDYNVAALNNRLNLKSVLKKIELNGFKSLCFQELLFIHQKIIDNSVTLYKKYTSLIEIAVKHLPSWQKGSTKQKHDIIHIFAILDKVMDVKNKNVENFKIDLASEIQKRIDIEKKYDITNNLLIETKMKYEQLVAKNKTPAPQSAHRKSNKKINDIEKFIQQCSSSRFTYEEIIAGKFVKCLENKDVQQQNKLT